MIEIDRLRVLARGTAILDDISLRIAQDQPTAIVGPSGAGKTSLLRSILGLAPLDDGSISIDGRPLSELSLNQRARWLAWLPQRASPVESLTALDYLLGSRHAYEEPRSVSRRKIAAALETCGVGHLEDRVVTRISGGELQRVQLAGLLAQDARFLLLDEPANHLDPGLQHALYRLLGQQIEAGRGVLAVTHEINLIAALEASIGRPLRVLGLKAGRLDFDLPSDAEDLDVRLTALYGLPHRRLDIDGRRYFLQGLARLSHEADPGVE